MHTLDAVPGNTTVNVNIYMQGKIKNILDFLIKNQSLLCTPMQWDHPCPSVHQWKCGGLRAEASCPHGTAKLCVGHFSSSLLANAFSLVPCHLALMPHCAKSCLRWGWQQTFHSCVLGKGLGSLMEPLCMDCAGSQEEHMGVHLGNPNVSCKPRFSYLL